jgi:hypothetical protein
MAFEKSFDFILYRERHAGPRVSNAVTVRVFGRKVAARASAKVDYEGCGKLIC